MFVLAASLPVIEAKVETPTRRAPQGQSGSDLAMASVAPLLQKLEPMAMMEEGGLQRASIAIKLLAHKSATDPSVGGGILEARGMRILLQTALLHPVPELREGAIVTILGCVQRADGADSAFVTEALAQQLPVALVRLCSEQDRRAKREDKAEEEEAAAEAGEAPPDDAAAEERAYDPDLPARRVAVQVSVSVRVRVRIRATNPNPN